MARPPLEIVGSILALLFGLVVALSGYRLAKGLAGLAGFLVGVVVGLVVGFVFGPVGSLVAALVLGIVFALLFQFAFRLVGGALGAVAGYAIAGALGWPVWAALLAALAGLVAGLVLNKVMVVAATAFLGAWVAVRSALELLADAGAPEPPVPAEWGGAVFVGALVLGALAGLAQWREVRHEDR